jgi:hypothetical protein
MKSAVLSAAFEHVDRGLMYWYNLYHDKTY